MATVDLILLAIIAIYTIAGFARGFVSTCLHTIASIASFFAALFVARLCAPLLASHLLGLPSEEQLVQSADFSAQTAQELWDSMSGYLQTVVTDTGVTLETLQQSEDPVRTLREVLQSSLAESIVFLLSVIVLFVLFSAVCGWLIRLLNAVAQLPVLHTCNALLGGITGALTGVILCTCILWALKTFAPAIFSDAGLLSPDVMQETTIARTLSGWNGEFALYEIEPQL